jgi:hypothetical protein
MGFTAIKTNTNKIEDHELKQKEGIVCHKSASNGGAIIG